MSFSSYSYGYYNVISHLLAIAKYNYIIIIFKIL